MMRRNKFELAMLEKANQMLADFNAGCGYAKSHVSLDDLGNQVVRVFVEGRQEMDAVRSLVRDGIAAFEANRFSSNARKRLYGDMVVVFPVQQ